MKFATIVLAIISTISVILAKKSSRRSMRSMVSQNFKASCSKIEFVAPKTLTSNCKNHQQVEAPTKIDLDSCFMNNNGKLAKGGAFSKTCSNCTFSGTTLTCKCLDTNKKTQLTTIDVNTVVNNNGGKLECKARRR